MNVGHRRFFVSDTALGWTHALLKGIGLNQHLLRDSPAGTLRSMGTHGMQSTHKEHCKHAQID